MKFIKSDESSLFQIPRTGSLYIRIQLECSYLEYVLTEDFFSVDLKFVIEYMILNVEY